MSTQSTQSSWKRLPYGLSLSRRVCAYQLAAFQRLTAQHLGEEEPAKKEEAQAKRLRRGRWNTERRSGGSLIVQS
ncbi:MAG: hypothetical protein WB946_08570 [Halobacteriota archaeon]